MEFSQIAILLVVAGAFGIIVKLLKQPLIVGYIFAGLLLATVGLVEPSGSIESLGQIGVTLLLFLLGLEMNLGELPSIGKVAVLTGLGQIIFTSTIGFLLATLLGFETVPAIYIAIALTFSSTIIMVKLLSEKKDLSSLYGKIAVGFLLVQDFVAVLILMFLSGLGEGGLGVNEYVAIGFKGLVLLSLIWFLSKKLLPTIFDKLVASSSELLFIVSIAWALGVANFVAGPMGFTLEIGGFLAGIALSNLPEHLQIATRTRPLRDFFLTLFFLLLGMKLVVSGGIISLLPAALIFSAFVLIGNPLIVLSLMGFLGYKKRTSFLAGLTVAQISEFSLIIMAVGLGLGHVNNSHMATIVIVGVITMTLSTYLILGADKIYKKINPYLTIFEKKNTKEQALTKESKMSDHIVLVGADNTGGSLAAFFNRRNVTFLVVDYNPKVYTKLTAQKIPVIFGDINDPDIFEAANVERALMVISTISNLNDNLTMLEHIKLLSRKPVTVMTSSTKQDALKLYEKKATYLIVPEIVAGEHIRHLIETYGTSRSKLIKMGKSHFNRIIYK